MLAIDGGQPRTLNLKRDAGALRQLTGARWSPAAAASSCARPRSACTWSKACWSRRTSSTWSSPSSARSKDPDEARWGLMHVLSPSLYEHERFVELPRLDLERGQGADGAAGRARAGRRSRATAGSQHRYEGGGFTEEQAKQHPRDAAAAPHRHAARGAVQRADRAHPGDRPAARTSSSNESLAARRDQDRAPGGPREVRRRAPHRDHRRGGRAHQRGPDRRGGHGRHPVATPGT